MFSQLREQTPVVAVAPIKMMRYIVTDDYTKSNDLKLTQFADVNDMDGKDFSTMKGKMIFNIKTVKNAPYLKVRIVRFSLRDQSQNVFIHEMDPLEGELHEDTKTLVLTGDAFVNINGKKHICRSTVKLVHSHGSFYEVEYCFETDDRTKAIFGMTILKKEIYDSIFAKAFSAVA